MGDSENDLEMLQYVGCGIAMGNSVPKVLASCKYKTLSNEDDGVAHAIETILEVRQ
jgi:hydroxymethylpyrimidine pyrophosphatase-like HAD family hydrolase